MPTDDEIKLRVKARANAKKLLEWMVECAEEEHMTGDVFWTEIRDLVLAKVPLPIQPARPKVEPMKNREAFLFEGVVVPFGKYSGYKIGYVAEFNPEWLDWLVGAPDEFKSDVARYLASERGRARLARTALPVG